MITQNFRNTFMFQETPTGPLRKKAGIFDKVRIYSQFSKVITVYIHRTAP